MNRLVPGVAQLRTCYPIRLATMYSPELCEKLGISYVVDLSDLRTADLYLASNPTDGFVSRRDCSAWAPAWSQAVDCPPYLLLPPSGSKDPKAFIELPPDLPALALLHQLSVEDRPGLVTVKTAYDQALPENKFKFGGLSADELWDATEIEVGYATEAYEPSNEEELRKELQDLVECGYKKDRSAYVRVEPDKSLSL